MLKQEFYLIVLLCLAYCSGMLCNDHGKWTLVDVFFSITIIVLAAWLFMSQI